VFSDPWEREIKVNLLESNQSAKRQDKEEENMAGVSS